MLATTLRFLRRNGLRIGVVLGTFVVVGGVIGAQDIREAIAQQDYQTQRAQVLADQSRAITLGLQSAEYSDLVQQETTTSAQAAPAATAPFNEARIQFFNRQATDEAQIHQQLQSRIDNLLTQTR
ncbi:MAG TPA: hypothetical protein VFR68_10995, partial [Candidatus Dormibacteraeota bacterium]|nr:hypothetical protein [Candidatus Dormibacteraeota bacterium]